MALPECLQWLAICKTQHSFFKKLSTFTWDRCLCIRVWPKVRWWEIRSRRFLEKSTMSQMDYKPLTLNPRWSKYYHCPLQTSPYHETNTVKPNQKCRQHTFLLRLKQLQLETFFPLYDFFHCSMDRIMSSSVLHLSCKFFCVTIRDIVLLCNSIESVLAWILSSKSLL